MQSQDKSKVTFLINMSQLTKGENQGEMNDSCSYWITSRGERSFTRLLKDPHIIMLFGPVEDMAKFSHHAIASWMPKIVQRYLLCKNTPGGVLCQLVWQKWIDTMNFIRKATNVKLSQNLMAASAVQLLLQVQGQRHFMLQIQNTWFCQWVVQVDTPADLIWPMHAERL